MKIRRKPIPKTDLRKQDLLSLINLDSATTIRVHEDDYDLLSKETDRKDVIEFLRKNKLQYWMNHIGKSIYLVIIEELNF